MKKIVDFINLLKAKWGIFYLREIKSRWTKRFNILNSGPRRCMEYRIFPYFHANSDIQNILLVGVAECTRHYEDYFKDKKLVYTIDIDPEKAVSGIPGRHITDTVENIDKYFPDPTFDAVLMNGVYGWGMNDEASLIRSLEKVRKVLKKGGVLLFGWDKVPKYDPIDLDSKPYFKDFEKFRITGVERVELDNKHHHIFDFYRKP